MRQSVYTIISKRIGFNGSPIHIPQQHIADALYEKVKGGDRDAFEAVFRYYRYGLSPENDTERLAANTIMAAYQIGEQIFRNTYPMAQSLNKIDITQDEEL